MNKCKSFKPNINNFSKILILGSMPGIKSLEMAQYYAHPQNRFWKIMGYFCNIKEFNKLPYENRINILLDNGYALWDVIKNCEREGSLDTNIIKEFPNNIKGLLKKYPSIKTICLNGNKAYSSFKKFFPEIIQKYNCIKMPSTSPANAKYKLEDLIKEWKKMR